MLEASDTDSEAYQGSRGEDRHGAGGWHSGHHYLCLKPEVRSRGIDHIPSMGTLGVLVDSSSYAAGEGSLASVDSLGRRHMELDLE